jgi:hypothetical protein
MDERQAFEEITLAKVAAAIDHATTGIKKPVVVGVFVVVSTLEDNNMTKHSSKYVANVNFPSGKELQMEIAKAQGAAVQDLVGKMSVENFSTR